VPAMTTQEFDQVLAAFSFVLEEVLADPPAHFDVDRLVELRAEVEELRLSALENEASARIASPDLESAVLEWMGWMGRRHASDE